MNRLVRILCVFLLSVSSLAVAQAPGTGLYAFGSFDSRGFDTVNIGNLNTHFEIPIVNKQGRGLPFNYTLAYDGLVWSTGNSMGTGTWQPDPGWGFHGVLLGGSNVGYVTTGTSEWHCPQVDGENVIGTRIGEFVYHDVYGRNHLFDYYSLDCPGSDPEFQTFGDGSSFDGSGYSYGLTDAHVHSASGLIINAPHSLSSTASGSITDSNGNIVQNNGNGTFTDTLGVTALTIGGVGSASSPLTFTYPVTLQSDSATTATATAYYRTYTVQTNFQCSGIVEYGATSVDLMDHITLADGSSAYSFTYEPTPGVAGAVTGRLASVTLPTGGTISYSYTDGCSGAGINADGTVGTLTRTTSDGSRNYWRAWVNPNATSTTMQDEKGNQTLYQFSIYNGLFYGTRKTVYEGAIAGATVNPTDIFTCYNGTTNCVGEVITPPITQTLSLISYNGGNQESVVNNYDSSGMLTSSTQGQWGGSTLQSQINSYTPQELLSQSLTLDGSNNLVSRTNYFYDEIAPTATSGVPQHSVITGSPGNQTSSSTLVGGAVPDITTSTAYYDTGVPVSTATPNGTTQFGYDPTQTFATQVTLPTPSSGVPLATSAAYEPQSGVQTSATGMNADQTQVTQYDRLLRPTSLTLPNGSIVTITYSGNDTIVEQTTGTGPDAITHTLVDGYGRKSRVAVFNEQSVNNWYQVDYCLDATGLLQFQTVRYQGGGWAWAKQCSGNGTTYAYDAIGRVTSSSNADGTANNQYNGRAVKTTDVNGVQKITQYDLLGRISAVCEVSNSTLQGDSPQDCGLEIGGTGFLTTYAYDLANHKTTITQGAQQRVFQTDAAGRTIYTSEPERGVTTYSYSYSGVSPCTSAGLCVRRTRPRANQTDPNVLTTTTTQYDSLGRVLSISYDDGTPTKNFAYDASVGWAILNQTNVKGVLSAAWIPDRAASVFSYDSMGRVNGMAECLPLWCGNSPLDKRLDFSYDLTGNLTSSSDGAGTTTSYSYTPAGEVGQISSSMSDATHPSTLVSNVQNGPNGPFIYSLGNGVSVNLMYDSLGRSIGRWVCYGANQTYVQNQMYCPGGTQQYAYEVSWQGSRATSSADTALNQGHWYGYDEFNRLTSSTVNYGTVQNFTYQYDRYGNRWQQNAPQGGLAPSYSFNMSNNQINGYGYDAAGNMTYDGFHSYTYDAEGNIIGLDGFAGATYVYNALNQRVQVDLPAVSHQYVYNASGQRVSVWDTNTHSQVQGQYYWGGTPIAFYDNSSLHFQHQNWVGTEEARTAYDGSVEGSYTSLPFGDALSTSGADNDPYHFAQLDHDSESWTEHAQFRNYSSTQGRWLSPDPYNGSYDAGNPQSLNRYAYVRNNPLGDVDPLGLDPDPPTDPSGCAPDHLGVGCPGTIGGGGDTYTIQVYVSGVGLPPSDPVETTPCWAGILCVITPPTDSGQDSNTVNPGAPKSGVVPKACRILNSRVSAGIQALLNAGIGAPKAVNGLLGFLASAAASGPSGGSSLLGAPGTAYLALGGFGQTLTAGGQAIYAITGDSRQSDAIIQNGTILSGPVTGLSLLVLTNNKTLAAQIASGESVLTAGPGAVDRALSVVAAVSGFCPP